METCLGCGGVLVLLVELRGGEVMPPPPPPSAVSSLHIVPVLLFNEGEMGS